MSSENLKFELLRAEDYSRYLLKSPREIQYVLQGVVDKRSLVTAYLDGGSESFLTALLEADSDQGLLIDAPPDEAMTARAMAAEQLVCVTQLDRVKIQFAVNGIESVEGKGGKALRTSLPTTLLRLQRREYFRLVAPVTHALSCVIPVAHSDGTTVDWETRVIDISGGGVAVMVPPHGVEFSPGMQFSNCRLTLPELGAIVTTLVVRNIFRITNRNGVTMIRAGCQFLDLPANADALIQRYIFKVERERSARERGN